jgi:hypothetical protein
MTDQLVQRAVLTGCQVAAQASPDETVQVSAGGYLFDNAPLSLAAVASLDILVGNPADSTNPRWDLVALDDAENASQIVGTPTAPDLSGRVPFPAPDSTKRVGCDGGRVGGCLGAKLRADTVPVWFALLQSSSTSGERVRPQIVIASAPMVVTPAST